MDVLYEDERIIVVDKPHFLATMPRGMWYRQRSDCVSGWGSRTSRQRTDWTA